MCLSYPFIKYKRKIVTMSLIMVFFGCDNHEYKIVVPNNYVGEVCLVKSKSDTNILTLDSNGIGYINNKAFEELRFEPTVRNVSGKNLLPNCITYNSSAWWARGKAESTKSKKIIHYLSFEIVPDSLIGKKQHYTIDLFKFVDTLKIAE
jgi:hypothetical protein